VKTFATQAKALNTPGKSRNEEREKLFLLLVCTTQELHLFIDKARDKFPIIYMIMGIMVMFNKFLTDSLFFSFLNKFIFFFHHHSFSIKKSEG
jgi:hypothetical protein